MKQVAPAPQNTALHPSEIKQKVDAFLSPLLELKVDEARTIDPAYSSLWETIQNLYKAGGKRLRPYVTLLAFQAYSNEPIESIIPAAAAQELIHLAMLIHDDIIDRDDIRYGIKNVTGSYFDSYAPHIKDELERRHFAQSAAILAGDLLISEAYILIAETQAPSGAIVSAQRLLSQAIFNVVGGELLDTEAAFSPAAAHPLVIAQQKTASYSFVSPLLTGATLAGASIEQRAVLHDIGEQLGVAYQLRDDLIGIFGNPELTGKSNEGDIKEGKRTLIVDEFNRLATDAQKEVFHRYFGKQDASYEEIEEVRAVLVESGARQSVEAMVDNYEDQTLTLVDQIETTDTHKTSFRSLISLCLQRER